MTKQEVIIHDLADLGDLHSSGVEVGPELTIEEVAANLMRDHSEAGVSLPDVVALTKAVTERMVDLGVAFPQVKGDRLEELERNLLKMATKKGNRLADTPPVYIDDDYSGIIAIQSPSTGEVAVIWRDFDEMVPTRDGTGEYRTYSVLGVARNVDEDEARAILTDAWKAKEAVRLEALDGFGWVPQPEEDSAPF